ncbi:hypothetical protein SNE40_012119 [Patella caerulea]|uniref:protein-tyrosine-phosphatase n=1 Tax=Patella caerulea TaxID=87958 RepID=A0AAN8PVC8_PATCE
MCSNNCKNSRCYISSSSPQCTEGCIDGYKGLYCQSPCPGNCARCDESSCSICRSDWYGTNCESPCSIKCNGGCDIVDGRCNRCKSHAVGLFCDIECGAECQLATGGLTECEEDEPCTRNCSESTVDESSDMVTLSCLYRCIGGKKEGFCAKEYQAPTDGPDNTIIISVVTVILVLAIAAISTFLVLRYRRRRNSNAQQNDKVSYVTPTNIDDIPAFAETTQISTAKTSTSENSVYVNVSGDGAYEIEEESSRISLKNLLKYIKDKKTKSAYEKEYKELPGGLCSSYDYCMNAVNKSKNRYKNICAFDHSRVKLDIMNGDPNSDYINACYITGYGDHKNKYVASQGPVVDIVNEFWRMIWIVETGKIIMLTNLVEIGVHKCFRYWPKLGKEKTFGEISITMTKEDTYANFTVRTLQVTKGDSRSRTITQYHYTSWPDKGVPTDTASLVEFRNKVQTSNTAHLGPMVVHCSAGIGRTGTFIALDYLIEEAKAIDSVDIFECVKQLRYERVNMVQTLEQYAFLHDAIAEWYIAGNMSFPVTAYHVEYQKLLKVNGSTGKSELQETFEMLDDICPSLNTEDCSVALLEENKTKNRDMTVLPSDKTRIRLYKRETDSSESEYINAVFLPSYRKKTAYILTQTPLPNTIIDFWRMVLERNVTVIINMDSTEKSANIGHFLPTKGELVCGPFIITIEDEVTQDGDYYNIVTFLIRDGSDGNSEKKIKVYQCNFWDTKKKIPKAANPIFEILDDIKSWSEKNEDGPLLVHCLNGVEKSGVFCVLAAILERLTIEQDVSIIQTLLQLRLCRPQIMASYEQVKFCFDAVGVYLDEFSTYANSC